MAWSQAREPKLAILTPSRGKVDIRWAIAYSQVVALQARIGPIDQKAEVGYAVVDARNNLVEKALDSGCTHLAFVDDDLYPCHYEPTTGAITAFPRFIERLMNHAYPLVSGLYWGKKNAWTTYFLNAGGTAITPLQGTLKDFGGGRIFADAVGGGFFLADARVFDRIPYPWFVFTHKGDRGQPKKDMGEDVFFGLAARKAGLRFLVDSSVVAMHGQEIFRVEGNRVSDQPPIQ